MRKHKKYLMLGLLLAAAIFLVGCTTPAPNNDAAAPPAVEDATPAEGDTTPAEGDAAPAEGDAAPAEGDAAPEGMELTLEQLAGYNGKDGKPAYVAVDGDIYDVTNAEPWKDGAHNGYEAGKDLTAEVKEKSPHGVAKLEGIPKVGKLVP